MPIVGTGTGTGTGDTGATVVSESTRREGADDEAGSEPRLPLASRIGRYVVIESIGKGAMGSVYAAYDPQLDRKVALKLIRMRGSKKSRDTDERRLLREAQAMAKLSHPNVVHVYDAGSSEQGVFIAMELVEGGTLRKWVTPDRTWREKLEAFLQAGRGLVAAHEAGLVHRDFKPDNVLVDERGRVRVLDFGLARPSGHTEDGESVSQSGALLDDEHLTQTGTVVGTPAYMSPEQFTNQDVDARSDQFSFCVALLEALEGRRPFEGKEFAVVASAVTHGRILPPPKRSYAPKWIGPIVRRGLAVDPADRYPSLRDLLEALERRTRRPRWVTGAVVVGLVAVGAVAVRAADDAESEAAPCEGVGTEVQAIWNDVRSAEVESALTQSGLAFADSTWSNVKGDLDRYASDWSRMRDEACHAALVDRSQTEDEHDRRVRCLQRRRRDLGGVVEVLARADADLVPRAPTVVGGLLPLERCADLEALAQDIEPPADPGVRQRVGELRTELDRVRTLRLAGRQKDAVELAAEIADEAERLSYAPVVAEALYWRGTMAGDEGRIDDARSDLIDSAAYAQRSGHSDFLASAYIGLIWTATGKEDGELVRMWGRWGRAVIARGQGDEMELARLEEALGRFYADAGDLALAYEHTKTGVELGQGDTPQNVAMALNNLGEVSRRLGRLDEAEAHAWGAYQVRRSLLGGDHPNVAMSLLNLGNIAQFRGDLDTAKSRYEEALAIYDRAFGEGSIDSAAAHNNLGLIATQREDPAEAIARLGKAKQIREEILGPENPALINTLANLGRAHSDAKEHDKAIALTRRALELAEKQLGKGHPGMAWPLSAYAIALVLSGDKAAAMDPARRAVEAATAGFGEDHPERGDALLTYGEIAVGHDNAEARRALKEALRVFALHDVSAQKVEKTQRLLSEAGGGGGPQPPGEIGSSAD